MLNRNILRVIDVNLNRAKEGLRVVEDILRFIYQQDTLRKKIRTLRHGLDLIACDKIAKQAIIERDAKNDLGKRLDSLESNRNSVTDILYSNLQRVKESLRVLEEFLKLTTPAKTAAIKNLRYKLYTLEKSILLLDKK